MFCLFSEQLNTVKILNTLEIYQGMKVTELRATKEHCGKSSSFDID